MEEGGEMKTLLALALLLLVVAYGVALKGSEGPDVKGLETGSISAASGEEGRVYPIAPGVWYPGEPLPEKPMRYYRVRCWPGCHRGSSYGMYPDVPLNMKPIFPTRTIDNSSPLSTETE
jgi:hypothetical protein